MANHQPTITQLSNLSLERLLQTAALVTADSSKIIGCLPRPLINNSTVSLPLTLGLQLLRPKPNGCSPIPNFPMEKTQSQSDRLTSILTAAVRLAVSSFMGKPDVPIQGKLVVKLGSSDCLTLSFNDEMHLTSPVPSDRNPSPRLVQTIAHETTTSSRRKSYHPTKLVCQGEESEPVQVPPLPSTDSGRGSPSVDSGALDLSRAGSLSDSAPMTPYKESCCSPPHSYLDAGLLETHKWLQAPATNNSPLLLPRQQNERTRCPRIRAAVSRRSTLSRRFPCNQCRDEFFSLNALEQHTLAAHGSYKCHICKADFTQRSNLQRHALKHIGFKPFECRVCMKAYYRKDHLMRHMEMVHPGRAPRENIMVHLTSSESLDYLDRNRISGQLPIRSEDGKVEHDGETRKRRTGEFEEQHTPTEVEERTVAETEVEAANTMEFDEPENSAEVERNP
ncbi:unnamed protein product [Schistocephalus solidus]|uniref:Zinc finger protein Gfi-1b n=1 Tax=Schistocephalus solidus TaxID=70667 RepID=A0A183TS72_SCHSO|nr:unnamed protein product [Schistocephalus solidus]